MPRGKVKKGGFTSSLPSRAEAIDEIVSNIRSDIALLQERVGSVSSTKKIPHLEAAIAKIESLKALSFTNASKIAVGAIVRTSCGGESLVHSENLDLYGGYNPNQKTLRVGLCHLNYFKSVGALKVGDIFETYSGRPGEQTVLMCKVENIR